MYLIIVLILLLLFILWKEKFAQKYDYPVFMSNIATMRGFRPVSYFDTLI